ncbi:ABC transporter permease [Parapedobacter koreensis]|uniref:Putative ABC transport system permease protein n=1 Tax=Parapedobacter koreensis TaxID=332977 RepID=A0A1H7QYZ5_9SPHI|nr:ABC transporter permease [Parapedobacter koreensis]SEL53069.1 putative ABC transport system permease protein [Parapedobacter koreensis]
MNKFYLKRALTSLWKRKLFSFINITGLTIGLAFAGIIGIYVYENIRVDQFQPERLYRVITTYQSETSASKLQTVGRALIPVIEQEIPEVEHVVPLYKAHSPVKVGDVYYFDNLAFAGEHFLEAFSFHLLSGNAHTALAKPYTAVLTKSAAQKYFKSTDAIGKILMVDDTIAFTVTAILDDLPASHIDVDVLLSFDTWRSMEGDMSRWFVWDMTCYVLLKAGADPLQAEQKIATLSMHYNGDEYRSYGYDVSHELEKVKDIYLHSPLSGFNRALGSASQLYIFSAIGIALLVLACINFINLTTALQADRSKEVGVRKTLGASKRSLAGQFLTETLTMVVVASLLAVGLIVLLLPTVSMWSGLTVDYTVLGSPAVITWGVIVLLATTVLAGTYPSLVLSKLHPVSAIKNKSSDGQKGMGIRRALVAFQFTVTLVLVTCTFICLKQLHYMRGKDLGFEQEQVAVISLAKSPFREVIENYESVKHQLAQLPGVTSVTASAGLPGRAGWSGQLVNPEGLSQGQSFTMEVIPSDVDYVKTLGIRMVAGRDFSKDFVTDASGGVLINETACRLIGWEPQEAIGKGINTSGMENGKIIGVMADYHQHGLQQPLNPILIFSEPYAYNYIALATQGHNLKATLENAERFWKSRFPGYPFEYFMLDDDFDRQYKTESNLARIIGLFAILTIAVACLGLIGLTTYTVVQKRKEIGIRKVLGASVSGIVTLLSKDFVKLILIAIVIASPIAWWAMNKWLENFAYRIDIQWWMFALAGVVAMVVALLTVSWQAIRAAVANPVESLRDE